MKKRKRRKINFDVHIFFSNWAREGFHARCMEHYTPLDSTNRPRSGDPRTCRRWPVAWAGRSAEQSGPSCWRAGLELNHQSSNRN